jgi:autotransporter-associated beta strand protein
MKPMPTLRPTPLLTTLAALLLALHGPAQAVTYNWSSAPASGNWATGGNWVGGAAPAGGATTDLNFGTSTVTTLNNNLINPPTALHNIDFTAAASSYTLGGNELRFASGAIVNNRNGNATQTFNMPVSVTSNLEFRTAGNIVLNGVLSSTVIPTSLTKSGANTLTLNAANTFNGTVNVTAGSLVVGNANALASAALDVATTGSVSFAGLGVANLANLAGSGLINLGASDLNLSMAGAAINTFNGTLSGTGGLTKTGAGGLVLGGLNLHTGLTDIRSGQLVLQQADSLKYSAVKVGVNNALSLGGLTNATLGGLAGPGSLDIGATNLTVDVAAAATHLYSGILSGSGNFVKAGPGTQKISGVFSDLLRFSGLLDIREGELVLGNEGSLLQVAVGAGSLLTTAGTATLTIGSLRGAGQVAVSHNLQLWNGNGQTFAGDFTGQGNVTLHAGDFSVTGASPLFQGDFNVGGALKLGHADALVAAQLVLLAAGKVTVEPGLADVRLSSFYGQVGSFADLGAANLLLTVLPGRGTITDGSLITTGDLTVAGSDEQRFSGSTLVGGTVRVRDQARLIIAGDAQATGYAAQDQATLTISSRNLGFATATATAGATVVYTSTSLVGGTLGGSGTHNVAAVGRYTGTTFASGVTINAAQGATLAAVTNLGTVNVLAGRTVAFNLGSNQLGTVNVAGTAQMSGWASVGGRVAISPGGSLVASGGDLAIGAGSTVTLGGKTQPGGTLTLSDAGATLQLGSSLLVNNGTLNGKLAVNYGSLAKGAGTFNGAVSVNDGGKFSPGNSPGAATTGDATWGLGGGYLVELASASGSAGTAWDLWNVNGALSVTAGSTANSVFTISLATLDANDGAALLAGFNPAQNYNWTIVHTTGGISGFDTQRVALNTSGFQGGSGGGQFALVQQGNDLVLNFTAAAVPEPATGLMWGLGLAGLLAAGRSAQRRRA